MDVGARFQNLTDDYFYGSPARDAIQVISRKQHHMLGDLLLFYRSRCIDSPADIDILGPVDAMLNCYSVLEIAVIAGFIQPPNDHGFWRDARMALGTPEVRHYYKHEPLKYRLPELLYHRLEGGHTLVLHRSCDSELLMNFFELDLKYTESLDKCCLIRMLEGFQIDGYSLDDVIRLLSDANDLKRHILLPSNPLDVRDEVLSDCKNFFDFCVNLSSLLQQLGSHPLLQSAIWSHYGYLFETLGPRVQRGAAEFLKVVPNAEEPIPEERASVVSIEGAIRSLTSTTYRGPVEQMLSAYSIQGTS